MGLKIAVSGKGGVGKTTVTGILAHLAAREGRRVLAVDADPDANLAAALGIPSSDRERIVPLARRTALIEERTGAKVKQYGQIFKLNPDVSDIVELESAQFRSIHLLVLGAVEGGGSGCACPESVLLRSLLQDIILYREDCVFVDFEAGLEHLGRGTALGVDLMLVIVEPGIRSLETAASIVRMSREIGIRNLALIGNKILDEKDEEFLENNLVGIDYLGTVPFDDTIREADREGSTLFDVLDPPILKRFNELWSRVKQIAHRPINKDLPVQGDSNAK